MMINRVITRCFIEQTWKHPQEKKHDFFFNHILLCIEISFAEAMIAMLCTSACSLVGSDKKRTWSKNMSTPYSEVPADKTKEMRCLYFYTCKCLRRWLGIGPYATTVHPLTMPCQRQQGRKWWIGLQIWRFIESTQKQLLYNLLCFFYIKNKY